MNEEGWSAARVRKGLRAAREKDHSFEGGAILGSMCTGPHPLALEAHGSFAETNLGDPDHFPGTKALEGEVLADIQALLHAPARGAGRFLTGGTEANLFALYVAREKTGKKTVVLPEHAHFSFEKAARLLGMRLAWVPCGIDGHADPAAMRRAVTQDTALMVAVAGSTELGLVDDVPAIARVARQEDVLLHVDAAFGGYILPFLKGAGRATRRFDFRVPGVWSITIDPHKVGMATIPAGVLMLRDGRDWDHVAVDTPYVSTDRQAQLLGTRPGSAAAATWAVHRSLGRTGFKRTIRRCLRNTDTAIAQLKRRGIDPVKPPELNVVTFPVDDAPGLADALDARGVRVNVVPRFGAIRLVINPHVTQDALTRFFKAFDEALADREGGDDDGQD